MIKEYPKGVKQKLSDHFSTTEFDCNCNYNNCTITYIDMDLVEQLEEKRNKWNKPVTVISGFRCVNYNKKVGGKKGSQHLIGKAADIIVDDIKPKDVAKECESFDGLGRYKNFTHVDVRGYKARW